MVSPKFQLNSIPGIQIRILQLNNKWSKNMFFLVKIQPLLQIVFKDKNYIEWVFHSTVIDNEEFLLLQWRK